MKNYFQVNESENPLDNVLSEPMNGMSADEAEAYISSEMKNISMVDTAQYPDVDAYVEYIMNYCYTKGIYPDYISSTVVPEKLIEKTGKREGSYSFTIFEFHFIGSDKPTEESISVGFRIDLDATSQSLSLYFY